MILQAFKSIKTCKEFSRLNVCSLFYNIFKNLLKVLNDSTLQIIKIKKELMDTSLSKKYLVSLQENLNSRIDEEVTRKLHSLQPNKLIEEKDYFKKKYNILYLNNTCEKSLLLEKINKLSSEYFSNRNELLLSKLKEYESNDSNKTMKTEMIKWKEYSSLVQFYTEQELKSKDTLMYKIHLEKVAFKNQVLIKSL